MNAIARRFYEQCVAFHRARRGLPMERHCSSARIGAYSALCKRHGASLVGRHAQKVVGVLDALEAQAMREAQP